MSDDFNPRSHERSDTRSRFFVTIKVDFNPRSHERSDGSDFFISILLSNFNPRSHERSDTHQPSGNKYSMIFQSTLPREERPIPTITIPIKIIFQSTLPREERLKYSPYSQHFENFNPRSHERSDSVHKANQHCHAVFQSTLPREERQKLNKTINMIIYFNPRSHERSDALTAKRYGAF